MKGWICVSISKFIDGTALEQQATTAGKRPISFPELFVVLNGCIPLIMLAYDAKHHQLGPDPIRNALHTTGLVALVLLIATLTITPLRRVVGSAQLFYYRRPLGLLSFLYAFAHLGVYLVYDRACNWQDAWSELLERRNLQVGAAAMLFMASLALTSTPRMVRWLSFARWKLLHRLIYLSAVAAVLHYYMETKADVRLPMTMASAVGCLLLVRLLPSRSIFSTINVPNAAPESRSTVRLILFANSSQSVSVDGTTTVLEAAESIGLTHPFECRSGICGQCKTRLLKGRVSMESDDALSETEKADGWILACQACPLTDVEIYS